MPSFSPRLLAAWSGLAWMAGLACGSHWDPRTELAEVACGLGRCFGVGADDRFVGVGSLVDSCGRGLLLRHATLVGAGNRIMLSGPGRSQSAKSPDLTASSLEECVDATADEFVAQMDLSTESGVATVVRDPSAEELNVTGNAAMVTGEGT